MKKNVLKIHVAQPVEKVFSFILDSTKISSWFDSIVEEIPSEIPTQLGTILKNRASSSNEWSEYEVTDFVPNKSFTLSQVGDDYRVNYMFEERGGVQMSSIKNGLKMANWKGLSYKVCWRNLSLFWKAKHKKGVIYE